MRLFMLIGLFFAFTPDADAQLLRRNRPISPEVVVQPKATPPAPKTAAIPVTGILTNDHRSLYDIARARAVGPLARKLNISRTEARKMIDEEADDATLHLMATQGKLKFTPQKAGGAFTDFLDWLITNQDAIMKLIQMIMALFGVDADVATPIALSIAWDYYNAA